VVPIYNEEAGLAALFQRLYPALDALAHSYELILVNDGSHDASGAVLAALAQELPRLRVITHERNRGYGGALITGFGAATKDWIFYTDGDGQYDPSEVLSLLDAVDASTTDVVQGWKIARGDPLHRRVIGRVYHHVMKRTFRLRVRDTDCDFRLIRRSLFERVTLRSTSGVICVEMMRAFQDAGARFVEVPVHHTDRPHGRSQFFRLPHLTHTALQLLSLWWNVVVRGRPG